MRFLLVVTLCLKVSSNVYFSDDVLFSFVTERNGRIEDEGINTNDLVPIVTSDNELLRCLMPTINSKPLDRMEAYVGPTPSELVTGIYTDKACLIRIESYWVYEICHGRYIRQFHEEKDTKQLSEYFLGNYAEGANEAEAVDPSNPPKQDFNGRSQAYYPVVYNHGTACDLTGQPRITTVNYICAEEGVDVFYSLTEISTCVYEAVVGINELCAHPMFKVQAPVENPIRCFAAPEVKVPEPKALRAFNAELSRKHMLPLKVGRGPMTQKTPEATVLEDIYQLFQANPEQKIKKLLDKHLNKEQFTQTSQEAEDSTAMDEFWKGKACLYGGTGWWKYEFCYGHSVAQYHEEKGKKTTKVMLGYFDREVHKEWAELSPGQARKTSEGKVYQVSMFYSRGDICKETNSLRTCEVKLTCRKDDVDKEKITIYLLEPDTCQYVLVVESPLFCDPIQKADKLGLFPNPVRLDKENTYNSGHIEL